jgi:hypothetical protein
MISFLVKSSLALLMLVSGIQAVPECSESTEFPCSITQKSSRPLPYSGKPTVYLGQLDGIKAQSDCEKKCIDFGKRRCVSFHHNHDSGQCHLFSAVMDHVRNYRIPIPHSDSLTRRGNIIVTKAPNCDFDMGCRDYKNDGEVYKHFMAHPSIQKVKVVLYEKLTEDNTIGTIIRTPPVYQKFTKYQKCSKDLETLNEKKSLSRKRDECLQLWLAYANEVNNPKGN